MAVCSLHTALTSQGDIRLSSSVVVSLTTQKEIDCLQVSERGKKRTEGMYPLRLPS